MINLCKKGYVQHVSPCRQFYTTKTRSLGPNRPWKLASLERVFAFLAVIASTNSRIVRWVKRFLPRLNRPDRERQEPIRCFLTLWIPSSLSSDNTSRLTSHTMLWTVQAPLKNKALFTLQIIISSFSAFASFALGSVSVCKNPCLSPPCSSPLINPWPRPNRHKRTVIRMSRKGIIILVSSMA